MNVLVLNAGSSTLKVELIATDAESGDRRLATALVDRIGSLAIVTLEGPQGREITAEEPLRDHKAAVEWVLDRLVANGSGNAGVDASQIHGVGHRVVHGGQAFRDAVLIDDDVIAELEDCVELAPLHNPANLKGIRAARELLGETSHVAVFDTAFHATMPETSFLYAIPYHYYRRFKVRRYGFHGTSHRYVSARYCEITATAKDDTTLISLHLGNGCSACAIRGGESFDTSMGFTPLEGLVMGTRSGDVDPSVLDYLAHKEGLSSGEVESMLNKQSGLLGISGMTGDMRELLAELHDSGDRRVELAIDIFCARARKYVGAYYAALGGAEALVFTGGIGENAPEIRARVCAGLECLGLELDHDRNVGFEGPEPARISSSASELAAYVIPTDEELIIARDAARVIGARGDESGE